jgi:hypothetical protein
MTPWMDALDKLRLLGYSVKLDGEKLRYACQAKNNPSHKEITPLLEALKVHKKEILNDPYFLIEQTLYKINSPWEPGTLKWMKVNRPHEWGEMLTLEGEINKTALGSDLDGLRGALSKYQGLILAMVKEFKAIKEEKGQVEVGEVKEELG